MCSLAGTRACETCMVRKVEQPEYPFGIKYDEDEFRRLVFGEDDNG